MSGRWAARTILHQYDPRLESFVPRGRYVATARGRYAGGRVIVGFKPFHTMGDSDRATRQIDTEMNAIVDAVYLAMGVIPSGLRRTFATQADYNADKTSPAEYKAWADRVLAAKAIASASPLWSFFQSAVSPIYDEWMKFRGENEYYNLFTSFEEYTNWLERARQLRRTVEAKGIGVETPRPLDLSTTFLGDVADKAGAAIQTMADIVKYALYAALGLGGAFVLTQIAGKAADIKRGR